MTDLAPHRRDFATVRGEVEATPTGTLFSREGVLEILDRIATGPTGPSTGGVATNGAPRVEDMPWPERLWVVPPDTRLGTQEIGEALRRSKSTIYHQSRRKKDPLPVKKLHGGLLSITAGDLCAWIVRNEGRP